MGENLPSYLKLLDCSTLGERFNAVYNNVSKIRFLLKKELGRGLSTV